MSIENISGIGGISGYNDERRQQPDHQDQDQAEQIVLDYLMANYNLSPGQASAMLSAVVSSGYTLIELANGLQSRDASIISRFEACIL